MLRTVLDQLDEKLEELRAIEVKIAKEEDRDLGKASLDIDQIEKLQHQGN